MNVLSLFDGISGGQLALSRAGVKVDNYFAAEIDPSAIAITKRHFPGTQHLGDVTQIKASDLPKIDILIGGSPCQSFSFMGDGSGFDGKSKLFWQFVRLLKECKPKYFFLENVYMRPEWVKIIFDALGVQPIKMNSDLVSAQRRRRLYWTNIPNVQPPSDRGILLSSVLEDKVDEKYRLSASAVFRVLNSKRARKKFYNKDSRKIGCINALYARNPTDGCYVDNGWPRKLTPTECEKLQTLPVGYTEGFSNTARYKAIGNGWTVDLVAHIFGFIPKD